MKKLLPFAAFVFCALTVCASTAFAADPDSLSIQKLVFVDDVKGLAQYTPRPGGPNFGQGDRCAAYVEVAGFSMPLVEGSQEEYSFNLVLDIAVKTPDGEVIVSQADVDSREGTAYSQIPRHFLWFYFTLEGWPEGDYVLEVGVRDILSGEAVSGELSLSVGPPSAQPPLPDVYETTGTLRNFEETEDGLLITLLVNRNLASALMAPDCHYYVNDDEVTQETFIERAVGEQVTVEFYGDRSDISLCRAHVAP